MKFAIAGCGNAAHIHAQIIQQTGTLAAVCDNIADKANAFAAQYHSKPYSNWSDLLQQETDIDVAVICTPNGLHAEHSIAALNAKCHVLCEMPMAIHVFDCSRMLEASVLNSRKLFVVKQNRFNAAVAAVKQLLEDEKMGKVNSFQLSCFMHCKEDDFNNSWKGSSELDGGILYTQFSQYADVLYWLCGEMKNVQAISKNANRSYIQFEDTVVAAVEMGNDVIGSIHATINSYKESAEIALTLFCGKATIKLGGESLNSIEYVQAEDVDISNMLYYYTNNNPQDEPANYKRVYEYVINTIETQQEQITNAYDSMKTIEVIEKIYTSARGTAV